MNTQFKKWHAKRILSLVLAFILSMGTVSIPVSADNASIANHVIISQIYGGGGNSGALYSNDFIELYNPTNSAIDLNGWSVQYSSSTKYTYGSNITTLSGSIGAGEYYLIQEAKGANDAPLLPTPDATGSIAMSGSKGKIALVSNSQAIEKMTDANVVDFVGYGSANESEGAHPTPSLSNTTAAVRKIIGVDTNDNAADFEVKAPSPHNGSTPAETKCATPTASIPSCAVTSGQAITFKTTTADAVIEYNTTSINAPAPNWTTGSSVKVTTSAAYYVRATKSGLDDSDVATFSYEVNDTSPITLEAAKATAVDTENLKVEGVVTYISGKNVYIQDTTGAICLYLTSNSSLLKVGDEVIAIGKRALYKNLIELSGVIEPAIYVKSHDNAIPDRGTTTIADIIATPTDKTPGYNHMGEVIQVSEATLTNTSLLTQNNSELPIAPSIDVSKFPGISTGDSVDVTLRVYDAYGTVKADIISMIRHGAENQLFISASPESGSVVSNTQVSLYCNDASAEIYYTLDGTDATSSSTLYKEPLTITGQIGDKVLLKAIAIAKGKENSDQFSAEYTIKDPNSTLTIKEVLDLPDNSSGFNVTGQIAYFATGFSNPVIQSVIDGKTYSLYIFGAAPEGAKVGDQVQYTGTYSIYNGLPELKSITHSKILSSDKPMGPELVTIADLNANGMDMLGRFVIIKNVTLGAYSSSGSTQVTDATGAINIYKATAYPALVEQGEVVDLYAMVACYKSTVQLYVGTKDANGYNVYDVVNDTKGPLITLQDRFLDAKANQDYSISATVEDNKDVQDVFITYKIGDKNISDQKMKKNTADGKYEYTIPSDQILATIPNFTFTITAVDVTGLKTVSTPITVTIDDKPQVTAVTPVRNSSTGDDKTPVISVTLENAGTSPAVTLTLKKDNETILTNQVMTISSTSTNTYSYTPSTLVDGSYTATVKIIRSEDDKTKVDSWFFTVGESKYKAYFGQLHSHTAEYSDGSGTLQDGLNYLSNITEDDNVDFVSFTDHSNYFDTKNAPNPAEALNDKSKMTAESLSKWENYVSTMDTFNQENAGSLLAFSGFEMTWSGGPGHINTFNSNGLVSRNNTSLNSKTDDAGMKAYYETLIQNTDPLANLSQFNHPGKTFGTFSDFAYWSPAYDNKMVAVEVGNGEGSIHSGGYFPSYSEYTKALDKGWHVAPTNNQDNHKGNWGNANTCRTVIITDNFNDEGLLTGLKNRSVYATEDNNLNINYTVNDLMMGSIIDVIPDTPLKFAIHIDDKDPTDTISKVEIITNSGRVAKSQTFTSNIANWNFEMPAVQGYYYVRVTEADKNMAVTAPIWVGQAPLVGINSLTTETQMPVTGEALKLKTTFFNNESKNVTLKSVEYTLDDTIIHTETLNKEIVSTGTATHEFNYTPTLAGKMTLVATAVFSINGQDQTFTSSIDLNIRASETLVYAGVDASHYNEYVDGNYKDSMGNFANLAAEYGVRVVELHTSEALIAATKDSKYKMLVLTPPTRRNGTAFLKDYKSYSDDEIAAISAFSKSGKTVIVTGWGDYYEGYDKYADGTAYTLPADEHMSAQQNKLLAAMGSTLRVSDDEIKDDANNGGQPQRLYLTNYNLSNTFLNGVKPQEQVYSNYGGSTIYSIGTDSKPSETLPSSVSPMVFAFETSYSSDDDKDGTTGIKDISVPKYDSKYMVAASETITHDGNAKSTVIVAGSAFMSNFEIQANMDSYATPQYSNYTILENIVMAVNPVIVTSIAEVQSANEDESFTIRGIATSNASAYDKNTAFFDCIYVQDSSAGINAFPVSGDIRAGQTVEITGKTSSYNGERQIAVEKIKVIDETIKPLPTPIYLTTSKAANGSHLGSLVTVSGVVESITAPNDVVESIYIKDRSNVLCRIFIDGYITSTKTIADLAVGKIVTATGLSSIDTEGTRIRIRDRADVVVYNGSSEDDKDDKDDSGNKNDNQPPTDAPTNTPTDSKTENVSDKETTTTSATVQGQSDSPNHLKASMTDDIADALIKKAKDAETTGKRTVIEIKIDPEQKESALEVVIPKDAFSKIATETKADVKVNTSVGILKFSEDAVNHINSSAAEGDVSIHISKVDHTTLSTEIRNAVGDRPVYDFSVNIGEKKVDSFGNGNAEISLPYTLQPGEDHNAIVVYYVDDSGALQTVRGNYNTATGTVDFMTKHFSTYMIGYNKKTFTDVAISSKYYDAISSLAARGITAGTSETTYSPSASLTRGQFIVLMMNAYGISPDENSINNFADAGNTYYTNYLATAKRLGIASGIGNNKYAPDASISRQDMFTLLYNALGTLNELPEVTPTINMNQFSDTAQIASYALVPTKTFVERGLASGRNGLIEPKTLATRAEMAELLYNLLKIQ
ncbi:S-layer homology domain-containing protein [Fusibacter ferrireducens]|uniref:S-layer homology domain-containing protein n=1 Tax=Fusibacter ferrireducens TaxID=2785058 RepID=A0ABR9ZZ89_9FIRM|nr:S-layer homology domain-containing protein [Fusibacter ferrireducens]MBF4695769.1 S-layer homology domain-containing protein [Fusibacter ferrireducens]